MFVPGAGSDKAPDGRAGNGLMRGVPAGLLGGYKAFRPGPCPWGLTLRVQGAWCSRLDGLSPFGYGSHTLARRVLTRAQNVVTLAVSRPMPGSQRS